jgi:hypothetical protein
MDKLKKIIREIERNGNTRKYNLHLYDITELFSIYEELEEKKESKTINNNCKIVLEDCKLKIQTEGIGWKVAI